MSPTAAPALPTIDEFRELLEEHAYDHAESAGDDRPAVLDCCEFSGCATCASCASCTA